MCTYQLGFYYHCAISKYTIEMIEVLWWSRIQDSSIYFAVYAISYSGQFDLLCGIRRDYINMEAESIILVTQ